MASDKAQIVQDVYAAWNRGETAIEFFDPEVEYLDAETVPGAAAAHGTDELRAYLDSVPRYWTEFQLAPQEIVDVGEHVVVVAHMTGTGRTSGALVERTWAYVWTLRSNKVLRVVGYSDRNDALEAASQSSRAVDTRPPG